MCQKNEELAEKISEIGSDHPIKAVLSGAKGQKEFRKIEIARMDGKYQASQYTEKQVFHEFIESTGLTGWILERMESFSQLNAWGDNWEYELKISKKGKVFLNRKKRKQPMDIRKEHNRKKNYILEEGTIIPPLIDMGIFTKDGKIVKSMYDKYKQINRFVEIVDDVIKTKKPEQLTIIDFGCGKSYLTFVLYYYLTELRGISVTMTGLDLKEEVIQSCSEAAKKYGYHNLRFELGDINGYACDSPVDMVITLHACDTATDYALYNAIRWNAEMIFSVPCCQHEVNGQIQSENFSALMKYGIIKERFSALITDAIRGSLLEYSGYSTQLLEFIDFNHTPKNILIRAVRKGVSKEKREKALREAERILNEFQLKPTLYRLLQQEE